MATIKTFATSAPSTRLRSGARPAAGRRSSPAPSPSAAPPRQAPDAQIESAERFGHRFPIEDVQWEEPRSPAPVEPSPGAVSPGVVIQAQGGKGSDANRHRQSAKIDRRILQQEQRRRERHEREAPKRAKRGKTASRKRAAKEERKKLRKKKETYLGLPEDKAWKEIIDARYHHLGPQTFDRGLHKPAEEPSEHDSGGEELSEASDTDDGYAEPGYLKSILAARKHVAGRIGERVDADFLEEVHGLATAHKQEGAEYHSGYRTEHDDEVNVSYTAKDHKGGDYEKNDPVVARAIHELDPDVTRAFATHGFDEMPTQGQHDDLNLHFLPKSRDQVRGETNKILDRYYKKLGKIEPDVEGASDRKLHLIAQTHRRLENLHPFIDANTRTNRLILHKMLVENGMSPAILENPLAVHLQSDAEWAKTLRAGMGRWQKAAGRGR